MFLTKRSFLEKKDRILYLPIETFAREFHSKLYLAYLACQKDWTVVIGPEYDINKIIKYLPSGVYFGIGLHKKTKKVLSSIKKFGHIILTQDEEGLDRWEPTLYKEYRIDPEINEFVEYFLCWGEEDKKIITSAFNKPINAVAVGNLRLDLLNENLRKIFFEEVSDIKNKNGDFILINGKFGTVNHKNGLDYYINDLKVRGWMNTPYKKNFHFQRFDFQKKIFEEMIELSIALAKLGYQIVVRPHPSESLEVWKKRTENYSKNIKIIRSGNIIPWLLGSKLVIHNGSTSAIEALLLDKAVISYRPYKNSSVETDLPNSIGICLENKQDVIKYLTNLDEKKFQEINLISLNILNQHIKINKNNNNVGIKIMNLIKDLQVKKKTNQFKVLKDNLIIEMSIIKSMITRKIFKKKFLYSESKCSKLNTNETKKILELLLLIQKGKKKMKISNLSNYSLIIS